MAKWPSEMTKLRRLLESDDFGRVEQAIELLRHVQLPWWEWLLRDLHYDPYPDATPSIRARVRGPYKHYVPTALVAMAPAACAEARAIRDEATTLRFQGRVAAWVLEAFPRLRWMELLSVVFVPPFPRKSVQLDFLGASGTDIRAALGPRARVDTLIHHGSFDPHSWTGAGVRLLQTVGRQDDRIQSLNVLECLEGVCVSPDVPTKQIPPMPDLRELHLWHEDASPWVVERLPNLEHLVIPLGPGSELEPLLNHPTLRRVESAGMSDAMKARFEEAGIEASATVDHAYRRWRRGRGWVGEKPT